MERIILASASPRRKELLERAGVCFSVVPGNADETIVSEKPEDAVQELSFRKAEAVAEKTDFAEGTVVLGADTIVVYRGEILGKPRDKKEAVRMLGSLQGTSHQVFTGVTMLRKGKDGWERRSFAECTEVEFYPVSEAEIRAYAATGDPLDKAGAYGIQGPFFVYVKGIRGDYCNVVGLPVARLFREAKKWGVALREETHDKSMYL